MTAFVFGGSRGIGAATVERLAQEGHAVAFTYATGADAARRVVHTVEEAGGTATALQADSTDAVATRRAVAQAVDRHGPLDVVVVNAGIYKPGMIDAVSDDDLDQMIAVNVRGVFLSIQAAVAHLVDGGRVITIGSNVAVRAGSPGSSVYTMTKTAVAGLVKGVALDLAPRRITVNNVQPGPVETDITAGFLDALAQRSPLQRVGAPAEVAGLVAWLASAEAGYVTGASLTIDGGFSL